MGHTGLAAQIAELAKRIASGTYDLLLLIGEADAQALWAESGALSCSVWLADLCGIELSTARSQLRVARALRRFPELNEAMARGDVSYAKARILVAHLNDDNVVDLVDLAARVPVSQLGRAIAGWSLHNEDQETIEERQRQARSVSWYTDADGMVVITARLEPLEGAKVCAAITQGLSAVRAATDSDEHAERSGGSDVPDPVGPDVGGGASCRYDAPMGAAVGRPRPSLAQQRADALVLLAAGPQRDPKNLSVDGRSMGHPSTMKTEIVVHVGPEGNTLSDGTPLSDNAVARMLPESFVSLLIHDTKRWPIDASPRRRFPTRRQRRVVDAREPSCAHEGCSTDQFLQYDHREPYARGGPTVLENLQRLCGPHNRQKNLSRGPGNGLDQP